MIKDHYGRTFETLRISLTDVCNLACQYCVEDDSTASDQQLSELRAAGQVTRIVRSVGAINQLSPLKNVRLTGGEPMLFSGLSDLIRRLKGIGIPHVSMTTNAVFLGKKAEELKAAGLDRVNISLDAVTRDSFAEITRKKNFNKVLEGIEASLYFGLEPKINAVIMKGVNDHQVLPLFEFAKERNISIRYLEVMKMGHMADQFESNFFSQEDILSRIQIKYDVYPVERQKASTANYWLTDDLYKFGIIANESAPFCKDCDRLRLDHSGKIFGCLSNSEGVKLTSPDPSAGLREKLEFALGQKQAIQFKGSELIMKNIGG